MTAKRGGWLTAGAALVVLAGMASASGTGHAPVPPGPPRAPLEQRLREAWRWRTIDGPAGAATFFRLVRPGRNGSLIALDDEGLASFNGWDWTRPAGWNTTTDEELRDVTPLLDGLLLVRSHSIATLNARGAMSTIGMGERPASVSRACHHDDGLIDIAFEGGIKRASIERLEKLLDGPEGTKTITAIAHEPDGTMWCATEEGFFRQEGEGWIRKGPLPVAHGAESWYDLALAAGPRILFLPVRIDAHAPVIVWDGAQLRPERPPGPSMTVSDATTAEEAVIVTTRSPELLVWREGQWHQVRIPSMAGVDNAVSVAALGEDRIAVAFASGRLAICELGSRQWESWLTSDAGVGENVNALAPSRDGGLWVATNQGVLRLHDGQFTDVHVKANEQELHDITGLAETDDGELWVGSGSGFRGAWRLRDGQWEQHAEEDGLGAGLVHRIRKVDDELWFTLISGVFDVWADGGLVRLKDGVLTPFMNDGEGRRMPRCYDVLRRRDGTLIAGTRGGLYVFDGQVWRRDDEARLYNRTIFALHEDASGALWVGFGLYSRGLAVQRNGEWFLLNEGTWRRAAAAGFAETPNDRLWFTSEKGLFLVTGKDCHEVSGLLPLRKFWPVMPDPAGGLWIGSTGGGLLHFRPTDDKAPQVRNPTIRFSDTGEAIASWTAADLWNATPPDELSFRLRLDGEVIEPDPEGGMQKIFDGKELLEPGDHKLTIAALDNLGNEHGDSTDLVFNVPPPAWRSWPVLLEASATVIVLVVLGVVLRNRRRERAAAAASQRELADRLSHLSLRLLSSQEDERRSISREMHDDLGQLLTAACLDIERAARLDDAERRNEALRTALRAARDTQRRVREISHMLRPSELDDHGLPQAVATVLSDFTSRSGIDIDSRVDLEVDRVPSDVANNVFRILQEALTNILRHAKATTAYVTLRATENNVELTVRDDGAGFAPESLTTAKHYGLLGMRERSELLGGKFSISSRPGGGTEVFVSIPIPHR